MVERSSIGAEIFCCRMVSECFVVKLRLGMTGEVSADLTGRFVVKARVSVVAMMGRVPNADILPHGL